MTKGSPNEELDPAAALNAGMWKWVMSHAPNKVRPRKASTLILLDQSGRKVRVLMGKRHERQVFMPGLFVFPGGGVEPGDRQMAIAGALDPVTEAKVMGCLDRPSPGAARMLALAAIRETFEETGLAIGVGDYGAPEDPPPGAWSGFAAQGVYPSLEDMHFIARAITPPRMKRRFDTFFFTADASGIAARIDGVVGPDSELVELAWVTLDEARSLPMHLITTAIIRELEARLDRGMSRHLPIPVYRTDRKGWFRTEA